MCQDLQTLYGLYFAIFILFYCNVPLQLFKPFYMPVITEECDQ